MANGAMNARILEKACFARAFEEKVYDLIEKKIFDLPIYLAAGQELIAAVLSEFLAAHRVEDKQLFIQHRGHSTYLSFGGDPEKLILELLGDKRGCANGMGGSASIQSVEQRIYGHDGLMGSQGPIAVGACYGNRKFTLCFTGDAAVEEDYFLAAIGWASTKKLPIWFIVEDNNLSILTEKAVRRNWEMADVAKAFNMRAIDSSDDPSELLDRLKSEYLNEPLLLNIHTSRKFWHAGAGVDDPTQFDRLDSLLATSGENVLMNARNQVEVLWQKYL